MCFYAFVPYKLHYACVDCRIAFKRHPAGADGHPCPACGRTMACAGHDFAAPRRRDARAWSVVAAVLGQGLRYEGFQGCGCGREPKYRPRTRAELRARRTAAARQGVPLAAALSRPDPLTPAEGEETVRKR